MNYYHIGRSNNSYTSSRSTHSHGGKSARSRRYAAGEGDRYERGTHPYIPSSGSTQCAPNSGHLSSRHQYREENSSSERYTKVKLDVSIYDVRIMNVHSSQLIVTFDIFQRTAGSCKQLFTIKWTSPSGLKIK